MILKGANIRQRNKVWCGGAIVSKRHIGGFYVHIFMLNFSRTKLVGEHKIHYMFVTALQEVCSPSNIRF